jgi:hypothetical protein
LVRSKVGLLASNAFKIASLLKLAL